MNIFFSIVLQMKIFLGYQFIQIWLKFGIRTPFTFSWSPRSTSEIYLDSETSATLQFKPHKPSDLYLVTAPITIPRGKVDGRSFKE